jgi:hypothetical protein
MDTEMDLKDLTPFMAVLVNDIKDMPRWWPANVTVASTDLHQIQVQPIQRMPSDRDKYCHEICVMATDIRKIGIGKRMGRPAFHSDYKTALSIAMKVTKTYLSMHPSRLQVQADRTVTKTYLSMQVHPSRLQVQADRMKKAY